MAESIFRSIDMEFQNNAQRLSRAHEVFKEEVTFAHRRKVQHHITKQQHADSKLNQIILQTQQNVSPEGDRKCHTLSSVCGQ